MSKEVLLGFSGGIDSAACVDILRQQGYSVRGLYIDTLGDKAQREQVKQRAKSLDLDLVIDNRVEEFEKQVIDYFCDSYLNGLTPAPCTVCNTKIKWASLEDVSTSLGIEKLATGHYFGVKKIKDKYYVIKGVDSIKNQSYYLWNIPQSILSRVVCPMYDKIKSDVMALTTSRGVRESMGVCFLRGVSYIDILRKRYPNIIQKGKIVDRQGREIGSHDGFPFYTIGQKRGLDIKNADKKYCIIDIDTHNNILTVGQDEDLFYSNLELVDCNIVDMDDMLNMSDLQVVIRGLGRNPEGGAQISFRDDSLIIKLENPAWAPALGQPSVIYCGDRVVGGGILKKYY